MNLHAQRLRNKVNRKIRGFFDTREYLEVETPILSPHLIPEAPIEVFASAMRHPYNNDINGKELYLIPSPEVWMKKLLAEGAGNIYQLTKSFRNAENIGNHHNPEFTMLEWYTVNADYMDSMNTAEQLFKTLAPIAKENLVTAKENLGAKEGSLDSVKENVNISEVFARKWQKISARHAFFEATGIDFFYYKDVYSFGKKAKEAGYEISKDDTWEQIFNRLFTLEVEPQLPLDKPVAIYDYPEQIPCLAEAKKNEPVLKRWEVYVRGVELANCYSEETDSGRVNLYYQEEISRKTRSALTPHTVDTEYPQLFDESYPRCSGVALGVDRLIMLLGGFSDIGGVILFPLFDILTKK